MVALLDRRVLEDELAKRIGAPIALAVAARPLQPARLSPAERSALHRLALAPRAAEWLRGRAALKEVLRRRGESEDTGALGFPHPRLSLSHSGSLAVAVGIAADVAGVGIDLELPRTVDPHAARFFLGDEEQRCTELLRLWTVKEALFKADPRNRGCTLREYELVDPHAWSGIARTPAGFEQIYATVSVNGGFLSVATTWRESC